MQRFVQNEKFLNFEPKMPHLGVLGNNFEKVLSYLKSAPSNLKMKIKMLKFGTKNSWFCGFLGWNWKILKSYLKSAPSELPDCKILRKKCFNWVYFQAGIKKRKKLLSYLKSAPSNLYYLLFLKVRGPLYKVYHRWLLL